mmetsp:Transcript_16527/g.27944  ORF Transcript_16527/g.27944 Transcript_16527/m.27944 type:complete len:114 (+) Transcript_16527:1614-1955(+)
MPVGEQCRGTNFGLLEKGNMPRQDPSPHTSNVDFAPPHNLVGIPVKRANSNSMIAVACFHTNKNEEARLQSQSKLHQQFEYSELAERCNRVNCIALLRCKPMHLSRRGKRVST